MMPQVNTPKPFVATIRKSKPSGDLNRSSQPPLASNQKTASAIQNKKPVTSLIPPPTQTNIAKNEKDLKNSIPIIIPRLKPEDQLMYPKINFQKRSNSLLKTIELIKDTFNVQLYDSGEIDGDSVSVFYNGSLLLSHQRLSDKPITLSLILNKSMDINEFTVYAENLGTIPPNTALMVVTDGDKRYEVTITSDTEKNGSINFVLKK